jgi:hypothetical protein
MPNTVGSHAGVEVLGQSIQSAVLATGPYAPLVIKLFKKHLHRSIEADFWYPLQAVLRFYADVIPAIGENTLFAIGKHMPEAAVWPADVTTIEAGLASIDIAYHLNHRADGHVMFDPGTGTMLEGIGHYRCEIQGKRRIVMTCDTPYPPTLDHGIITGTARKWKPWANVALDPSKPSRPQGGASCSFVVEW